MSEIIYILTNAAMSGLCKIGYTNQPIERRLQDLSRQTGVPLPFECFYAKRVKLNAIEIEQWLHELFEKERINPRKEFFTTSPEKVVLAMRYISGEEVTLRNNVIADDKQEIEALRKVAKRRENFSFKTLKIPIGSKLVFIYDKTLTCTVVSDKNLVEFQGEKMSASNAARKAYGKKYRLNGALYWMYKGKTLDERRNETR